MRALWRLFSSLVTLSVLGGAATGVVLWQLEAIGPETFGLAFAQDTAAPAPGAEEGLEETPADGNDGEGAAEPTGAPQGDRWLWEGRLKQLRAEIDEAQAQLDGAREEFRLQQANVDVVLTALAELVHEYGPPETSVTGDVSAGEGRRGADADTPPTAEAIKGLLRTDASYVARVAAEFTSRRDRTLRIKKLRTTLAGMRASDAAQLMSESQDDGLWSEILWGLDESTRSTLLAALVKEDPQSAGRIFRGYVESPAKETRTTGR